MDFLLSKSISTSAADVSCEKGNAHEWMRTWVAGDNRKGGAAAAATEQGKPQKLQSEQQAAQRQVRGGTTQEKKKPPLQGRPCFAPEFDGLNCFETIVFQSR